MVKFLYVVAVIIGFASTAYARIKCYECNSDLEPGCGDPFTADQTFVTECGVDINGTEATSCATVTYEKTTEWEKGKLIILRSCSHTVRSTEEEDCKQLEDDFIAFSQNMICYSCYSDLCNSSISTGIFAATIVFLVVIVRLIS